MDLEDCIGVFEYSVVQNTDFRPTRSVFQALECISHNSWSEGDLGKRRDLHGTDVEQPRAGHHAICRWGRSLWDTLGHGITWRQCSMRSWRLVDFERQRQVGGRRENIFVAEVLLLHRRKILSEEGTRVGRVLDSLG